MKKCKQILLAVCLTFAFVFLTACGSKEDVKNTTNASGTTSGMETTARESTDFGIYTLERYISFASNN